MFKNKERIFTYLVIAFICVVFIVVMFVIWGPSKINPIEEKIRNYDTNINYNNNRIEFYRSNALNILNSSNFNFTYEKISKDFLSKYSLSSYDEAYDFLQKNMFIGSNIELLDVSLINNTNDVYLYKITYSIANNIRYLLVKEDEINTFSITFSFDGLVANIVDEKIINEDGIEYKISVLESRIDSIKLNLSITNYSEDKYEYDFKDLYSIQIILEDGSTYNLTSVVLSGNNSYVLNYNSSFNIELVYQIPQEQQPYIKKFKLNNVIKNDIKQDIIVNY